MKLQFIMGTIPNFLVIKKSLITEVNKLWRNAIRVFIERIVFEDVVKVDTGMARATLLPLARAVRMFMKVRSSIRPKRIRPGYSISEGEAYGKRAMNIKYAIIKEPILVFIFKIELLHYILQEIGKGYMNKSPAWKSLEKGQQAFNDYIKANAKNHVRLGMGIR